MVLQAAEEEKQREIEQQKQQKRLDAQNKKRAEKEKEEKRREKEEQYRRNCIVADNFYASLTRRRGLNLFKKLIARNEEIVEIIQKRQNASILRQVFDAWRCQAGFSDVRFSFCSFITSAWLFFESWFRYVLFSGYIYQAIPI